MAQSESPEALNVRRPSSLTAVFLVGFMGAGKTTVGRELSRRLGWKFIDLDDLVEAAEGRSIAELFADSGEQAFRQAESRVLAAVISELQNGLNAVVSLGGGAFVNRTNVEAIRTTAAPVVFLDAPVEELRRRCAPKGGCRPLFQDAAAFAGLYSSRQSSYMKADFRVDTAAKSVPVVAVEVLTFLGVKNS